MTAHTGTAGDMLARGCRPGNHDVIHAAPCSARHSAWAGNLLEHPYPGFWYRRGGCARFVWIPCCVPTGLSLAFSILSRQGPQGRSSKGIVRSGPPLAAEPYFDGPLDDPLWSKNDMIWGQTPSAEGHRAITLFSLGS